MIVEVFLIKIKHIGTRNLQEEQHLHIGLQLYVRRYRIWWRGLQQSNPSPRRIHRTKYPHNPHTSLETMDLGKHTVREEHNVEHTLDYDLRLRKIKIMTLFLPQWWKTFLGRWQKKPSWSLRTWGREVKSKTLSVDYTPKDDLLQKFASYKIYIGRLDWRFDDI